MDTAVTFLNLLTQSTPLTLYKETQEQRLIAQLNDFFRIDHNIFLLDATVDFDWFIKHQNATPQSVFTFTSMDETMAGLETWSEKRSKNELLIVAPRKSIVDRAGNMLTRVKDIQR